MARAALVLVALGLLGLAGSAQARSVEIANGTEPRFTGARVAFLNQTQAYVSGPKVRLWERGRRPRAIHRIQRPRVGDDLRVSHFEASSRRIAYEARESFIEDRILYPPVAQRVVALSRGGRSRLLVACENDCAAHPVGPRTLGVAGRYVATGVGRSRDTWLFDTGSLRTPRLDAPPPPLLPTRSSADVRLAGRLAAWNVHRGRRTTNVITVYHRMARHVLHRVRVPGERFDWALQRDGKLAVSYVREGVNRFGWFGRGGGRMHRLAGRARARTPGRVFIARNRVARQVAEGRARGFAPRPRTFVATRLDGGGRVALAARSELEDFDGRCFLWDAIRKRPKWRRVIRLAPARHPLPRRSACR